MSDNGARNSRNSINQIRDLIRKGALAATITPQAGLSVDEAQAPANFLKNKGPDNQIT